MTTHRLLCRRSESFSLKLTVPVPRINSGKKTFINRLENNKAGEEIGKRKREDLASLLKNDDP